MRCFDTVFLDRDGVVIVRPPDNAYVRRADDVVVVPGAAAAIGRLNSAGMFVVLVTNQRGVARGLMTLDDVDAVNARLAVILSEQGAWLDAVYVCPHEVGTCDCRKPAPGLLLRAAREHLRIDFRRAVMIGDAESDVVAGTLVGSSTIRLAPDPPAADSRADLVVTDLAGAVDAVLGPQQPACPDQPTRLHLGDRDL